MINTRPPDLEQSPLQSVLYGLWRRQLAVLAIATLLLLLGVIAAAVALLFVPVSSADHDLTLGLSLGCLIAGIIVGVVALTRLNPRKTKIYLLLKHSPEAIANVYFDIKYFRGYPYEYVVFQTQPPRRNYVISGIQRIGIPATLTTLQQICPEARFSCSPLVRQRYFSDSSETEPSKPSADTNSNSLFG